ncbi:ACP S-malonyltransferase [Candidatus Cardinium hertigii]|uniref:Malonyl CoA-acyl carrier protein transacylase n=1 Tax=Candidatus Cardinium hertigii TaxID=247481 RepID=A0A3N2QBS1_9BACT|nr:ACP S-malonyltransferase [Candidatus Cardinium hertigii]ROT47254.1 [acyl-carrier-protein] S-malonyltransferase [Candidatus Cardinium hertigii]
MGNTAYMFPGQGSQYKGMGKELFALFPNETQKASQLLGYDLVEVCVHNPNDHLHNTAYTQPAIYFISCLSYLKKTEQQTKNYPDFVLGHSLGEYAALFASGVFDLYTGLNLLQKRGALMSKINNGSMMAIIGPNVLTIHQLLEDNDLPNIGIANFNSFEQIVLSGNNHDIIQAKTILERHNYRCITLKVSGAFHSKQMEPARVEFMRFLMHFKFNAPKIPVISTTTVSLLEEKYILETLGFQLVKSVKWVQSILYLQTLAVDTFIELGPGNVLSRLNSHILK